MYTIQWNKTSNDWVGSRSFEQTQHELYEILESKEKSNVHYLAVNNYLEFTNQLTKWLDTVITTTE